MVKNDPIRLGDMQENPKVEHHLLYVLGQKLKVESMDYPTPCPLSNEQDLCLNKWELRPSFKYNLFDLMPESEEKEKDKA